MAMGIGPFLADPLIQYRNDAVKNAEGSNKDLMRSNSTIALAVTQIALPILAVACLVEAMGHMISVIGTGTNGADRASESICWSWTCGYAALTNLCSREI